MARKRRGMFICDRSGFKYPRSQAVREPGTGLIVHKSESDGKYSLARHPQNFPPKIEPDPKPLPWVRPDIDHTSSQVLLTGTSADLQTNSGDTIIYTSA